METNSKIQKSKNSDKEQKQKQMGDYVNPYAAIMAGFEDTHNQVLGTSSSNEPSSLSSSRFEKVNEIAAAENLVLTTNVGATIDETQQFYQNVIQLANVQRELEDARDQVIEESHLEKTQIRELRKAVLNYAGPFIGEEKDEKGVKVADGSYYLLMRRKKAPNSISDKCHKFIISRLEKSDNECMKRYELEKNVAKEYFKRRMLRAKRERKWEDVFNMKIMSREEYEDYKVKKAQKDAKQKQQQEQLAIAAAAAAASSSNSYNNNMPPPASVTKQKKKEIEQRKKLLELFKSYHTQPDFVE